MFTPKMYDNEVEGVEVKPDHMTLDDHMQEIIFKEGLKTWDECYDRYKGLIQHWGTDSWDIKVE